MMLVVPPCAAAIVPVRKSSEASVPPNGSSICVWGSMPPGITSFPTASITWSITFHLHLETRANHRDAFILDQNVRLVVINRGHHTTILDKRFHRFLSTDYTDCNYGFLRHGLVAAVSAARRASSLAFGPGRILSVTQISDGVIFDTARYELNLSGWSGFSLAL